MTNHKNLIFVYGSLKRNKYNFNRCGKQEFVKDYILRDYEMYSLGAYPCVSRSIGGKVVGEIHAIDDETLIYINSMESGAGYVINNFLLSESIESKNRVIYYEMKLNEEIKSKLEKVKGGNW